MGLYANRLQVPIKELSADWIPEEGELFQDSSDNLYMGDNVTASNALTPINGGGGGTIEHDPFGYSATTNPSGIGIAEVRFNSTTFGSITKMYVSDNDQNSVDLVAEQSIMTSGVAKLYKAEGGKLSFQVTRMVDQSGYFEYDVAPLSGTMPTVGEVCYVDFVPDAPGVRELIIGLLQAGTSDPTDVVIKNSYQQEATPSRIDVGTYKITIPGAFTANKTVCDRLLYNDIINDIIVLAQVDGTDEITITTFASGVPADDILGLDGPTPLRIRTTI